MAKDYVVYGIIDPRSSEVFYVGRTSSFVLRCEQHRNGTDQISGLIVRQINETGFIPQFVVLERCDGETASVEREAHWIDLMLKVGAPLTNAEAYNDSEERDATRSALRTALDAMRAVKHPRTRLRAVSLVSDEGERPRVWTKLETARLKGMAKHGMSAGQIARTLRRPVKIVKARLAKLEQDHTSTPA